MQLKTALHSLVALVLTLGSAAAYAQAKPDPYPSRTVTIIVPVTAGAATDIEARLYATKLSEGLGKPFVLDFKPGAGTTIGTAYVAKAVPGGYTLHFSTPAFAITPAVYKDLPYDPLKDMTPVSLMTKRPVLLLVSPNGPVKTFAEYQNYVKTHPGAINYATSGAGGSVHLGAALLHSMMGNAKVTYVHYKGTAQGFADLFAGRIQATSVTLISSLPHLKSGKLIALGTTGNERYKQMPELPTIAEQGLPGFEYYSWIGISAPGRLPGPILSRLNGELARIAKQPDVIKSMEAQGSSMVGGTPEQFRQFLSVEIGRWKKLATELDLKPED